MTGARSRPDAPADVLRRARSRRPEAADLLNALAFLDERPVPVRALRAAATAGSGDPADALTDGSAPRTLSALTELGALARRDAGIFVPGDVAAAIRSDLVRPVALGAADGARAVLEAWRERLEEGRGDEDAEWRRLADHAVALAASTGGTGWAPDPALRVGTRAAGRLQDRTRPERALRLLTRLEEAADPSRLREPFLAAAIRDQRAGLLAGLGREEEAAATAADAVARGERVCAEDDPRRAVLLHNAGGVLKRIGRLEYSVRYYDECYELLQEHHESGTPLELQLCLDLSDVLLAREECGRAAEVAGRAVAMARERLGRRHPETAAAVSNLGRAFRGEGRLGRARTAFEQAIRILEDVHGPEHPSLGPDLSNLGATLEEAGEPDRARELHERALRIFRRSYGEDHRLTRAARAHVQGL